MYYLNSYESPLGAITLTADGKALTGLWFDGQRYDRKTIAGQEGQPKTPEELPVFAQARQWLDLYFTGKDPGFTPELNPGGSEFRRHVAEIMLEIPFGQLMTYGQIAKRIAAETGKEKVSAQAVGGAVGHNPISLIIPCHRVVGTGGSLTGYGGGIQRKVWLLQNEGIDFDEAGLFVPTKGTAL